MPTDILFQLKLKNSISEVIRKSKGKFFTIDWTIDDIYQILQDINGDTSLDYLVSQVKKALLISFDEPEFVEKTAQRIIVAVLKASVDK